MNDQELYQKIWDGLEGMIPELWKQVVFYAEYGEGSFTMEFYVGQEDHRFVKCFDLSGIDRSKMLRQFMLIDQSVCEYRKTLSEDQKWTNMTLIIGNDGKFKAEFDYTDLTEQAYEYKKHWEEVHVR